MKLALKDPSEMSPRETRGAAIATNDARPIAKVARNQWHVPSQSRPALAYVVTAYRRTTPHRWTCSCPDYEHRTTTCKHIHAVHFLLAVQNTPAPAPTLPQPTSPVSLAPTAPLDDRPACKFCSSCEVVKVGVKSGSQQYRCKACSRKFVPATGFERISADPQVVCLALDLSFKGLSLREVTDTLNQFYGLKTGKSTIHRWLDRYVTLLNDYAAALQPQVGDKWHADEVFTKFSGKLQYVWHLMDAKTRYLLVSRVSPLRTTEDAKAVFTGARTLAGKAPAEVVTDGLPAYKDAFGGAFNAGRAGASVKHTREIHLSKPNRYPENNKVERLNATLRKRQKVARGLKKPTGPLTRGHAAFYNLMRPHQALGGKTPAEAAGALSDDAGPGRWLRVIRASATRP